MALETGGQPPEATRVFETPVADHSMASAYGLHKPRVLCDRSDNRSFQDQPTLVVKHRRRPAGLSVFARLVLQQFPRFDIQRGGNLPQCRNAAIDQPASIR